MALWPSLARTGSSTNRVDEAMVTPAKFLSSPGSSVASSASITPAGSPGPSPVTAKTYNPQALPMSPPVMSGGVIGAQPMMVAPKPQPGSPYGPSSPSSHPPGTYYNNQMPQTTTNTAGDPSSFNDMKATPGAYGSPAGSPPGTRPHYHGHGTPHHYAPVPQHASPNPALSPGAYPHRASISSGGFGVGGPQGYTQQRQQLMGQPGMPPHVQQALPYNPQPTQGAGYRG
jgi:hypothetical protein